MNKKDIKDIVDEFDDNLQKWKKDGAPLHDIRSWLRTTLTTLAEQHGADLAALGNEIVALREDLESATQHHEAEVERRLEAERERILNLPRYMFGKPNGDKIEMLQTIAVLDIEALTPTKTDNNKDV